MAGEYVKVCTEDRIENGGLLPVRAGDKRLLLVKDNNEIYAVDDECTHDGGELGDGDLIEGQIECPRHGARFDIKTGAATRMPAVAGIGTYKVRIENGDVFVAIAK
jgi:nitrite reductase/ring-hydroxylating ferredoxin subunit